MISIFAIIVIATLEGYAIYKGIDGKCLGVALIVISGLAGYKLRDIWPLKK